ncbi:muconate cycloisomerase [Fusarium verticillioides 7600]|uniref:Muconate cycloisomerase n=1 Tax=Gibberella moniliformis (strain M3125 / FGSC 7600) TaxID=334819 RepID=W7M3G5_GIBM7|nr:muconate cycloisomerase [Fusarium verticillioides 7600]EWG42095.1 muconate cycloisomerase [Fusarium verticillioides 7600]
MLLLPPRTPVPSSFSQRTSLLMPSTAILSMITLATALSSPPIPLQRLSRKMFRTTLTSLTRVFTEWSLILRRSTFILPTSVLTRSGPIAVSTKTTLLLSWSVLSIVPDARDHPRWVAMHPTGNYLYALMEKGNRICEYLIDPATRLPVYTHKHYPLIPPGIPDRWTQYRADVCVLSSSGKYLFASSRANSFDLTGYVAAFKLSDTGAIERQICLNPTPTSGGHSNAVAPCPWTDEWVAITDDQEGWLEIYRWQDEHLARVARVRTPEPGFGMNAIWYD